MESKDERYMRLALAEAQQAADRDEVPIGAVIVCEDRVIARAHNFTEPLNDVTAHAEMQAITSATNYLGGKYLTNCTLYVTVEPCLMCAGALGWSQIRRIVLGTPDDKRVSHMFCVNPFHKKTVITSCLLKDDCAKVISVFFKMKR